MVTGCSTADLAVVLVDARAGILEQTRRHVVIAALLRVPRLIVAVNKMDLVGFRQDAFRPLATEIEQLAGRLGIEDVTVIPVSALRGDNVVTGSSHMPWYEGQPLLEHLETVDTGPDLADGHVRLPIQWIVRDRAASDYRAFAGRIERGTLRPGDDVVALPSNLTTRVESIDTFDGPLAEAFAPLSVAVRLADDVDLGRGGLIAGQHEPPAPRRELEALVCWLGGVPLTRGRRYRLTHTTRTVRAVATELVGRLDINTLELDPDAEQLGINDVGRVRLLLSEPIFADFYADSRATGSAILVDEATNETVGAVLVSAEGQTWP
jgi:bifunctional enzyme CysN/CysC